MTKRQAMKIARRLAYEAVQKAVDAGPCEDEDPLSPDDRDKVEAALDEIAQRLFERSR